MEEMKMMITEHESDRYAWNFDSLYGVGCFARKSDGAVTYLETGSDCVEVRRGLNRLASKTASPRYPKSAPTFGEVFDSIASEYEFHGE
jgi:hypothetical protein